MPKASDSPSSPVPESILAKPLVESPKMMDKSLPYCLPYHATGPKMPGRAVTIDEGRPKRHHPAGFHFPTLHDHAKEGRTPLPSSPRRPSWPRRVASGWSTFRADLVRDWERRHDPEHVGFWSRAWDVISLERWARKERERIASENQGRNGDPDWIPPKYRWTPILSGVLVPFSILLEIPGLTEHWYVKTIDNVPVVYQSNPALLDVALGISLACAVVSLFEIEDMQDAEQILLRSQTPCFSFDSWRSTSTGRLWSPSVRSRCTMQYVAPGCSAGPL